MSRSVLTTVALAGALLLAGCGSDGTGTGGTDSGDSGGQQPRPTPSR